MFFLKGNDKIIINSHTKWRCWSSNPDHNVRYNNFDIFIGWVKIYGTWLVC